MKHLKSVLAGSAAGLLTIVAAQAADMPSRKAAPVEYVRVCDAYGAGFYWIPGTDTCLKIGGRVRVDTWYTPSKNSVALRSYGGGTGTVTSKNAIDSYGWYTRGLLMMDSRTQSAWGTVQTVFTIRLAAQSGLANAAPTSNAYAAGNTTGVALEAAYIRFAGFTVGQAASNFTFLAPYQYHSNFSPGFPNGIRQLAYTATFGGGYSATLALENRGELSSSNTANSLGAVAGVLQNTAFGSSPQRLPVLVGNLRIDQGWGSAMLAGAVLQNTATISAGPAALLTGGSNAALFTKTGWAISAGLRINLPMLAAGDSIQAFIAYGDGALDYTAYSSANENSAVTTNYLGGFLRNDRNLTVFCTTGGACGVESTKAFNLAGMFTHYWTPWLRSNLIGSYARITPGTRTQNTDWTAGGLSQVTAWDIKHSLIWSPVRNFDIGLELSYARLTQRLTNNPGALPTALACTAASAQCSASVNTNNWTGRVRVERTF